MSHSTLVFIHGLWLPAASWRPWQDYFEQQGWATLAPRFPGEASTVMETRRNAATQAGYGIEDLTTHFRAAVREVDGPVVAIGHSIGGLVAQKLLGANDVAAAIAIDPAPIKGVKSLPFSQLRSAFPVLRNPSNKRKAVRLSPRQFHYSFGNALSRAESDRLWERWSIPAPARPLFEVASANLTRRSPAEVPVGNEDRGPLLLLSGTRDHTVPDKVTAAAYGLYARSSASTELRRLEGRGHSLTVDHGWEAVAEASDAWLRNNVSDLAA